MNFNEIDRKRILKFLNKYSPNIDWINVYEQAKDEKEFRKLVAQNCINYNNHITNEIIIYSDSMVFNPNSSNNINYLTYFSKLISDLTNQAGQTDQTELTVIIPTCEITDNSYYQHRELIIAAITFLSNIFNIHIVNLNKKMKLKLNKLTLICLPHITMPMLDVNVDNNVVNIAVDQTIDYYPNAEINEMILKLWKIITYSHNDLPN